MSIFGICLAILLGAILVVMPDAVGIIVGLFGFAMGSLATVVTIVLRDHR